MITLAGVKPEGILSSGGAPPFGSYWSGGTVGRESTSLSSTTISTARTLSSSFTSLLARYPDEVIVIQMDQASAHRAHEIDWPENIIPLFQPAYTPEVNPIERFWKQSQDAPYSGETFKNLKSLRQRVNTVLSEMTTDCHSLGHWMGVHHQMLVLSASSN